MSEDVKVLNKDIEKITHQNELLIFRLQQLEKIEDLLRQENCKLKQVSEEKKIVMKVKINSAIEKQKRMIKRKEDEWIKRQKVCNNRLDLVTEQNQEYEDKSQLVAKATEDYDTTIK